MPDKLTLEVSRDGWTGGLQLSINQLDENGAGSGYRLAGPKFNGSGETLIKRTLDERDAKEIRRYLGAVFPQAPGIGPETPAREQATAPGAGAFPLTCEWCLNSPATHLLIWDYRQDGESYSDRHQQAVCGPCAHRQTVLTADFTGWWLFRLVPEDAGKCGEIERSAPVAWPQEQAATAGEEDRERE